MTVKFLILISFIISQPYATYGFDAIQMQVDQTCETVFNKLNLEEYINPLGQDNDDTMKMQDIYRQSLKVGLAEIKEIYETIGGVSFRESLNISIEKKVDNNDQSFCPTIDQADSFVFNLNKFNSENSALYYSSASFGNADGIFALDYYYETEKKNNKRALMFYCYAAYKNSEPARKRLGNAYFHGELGLKKMNSWQKNISLLWKTFQLHPQKALQPHSRKVFQLLFTR